MGEQQDTRSGAQDAMDRFGSLNPLMVVALGASTAAILAAGYIESQNRGLRELLHRTDCIDIGKHIEECTVPMLHPEQASAHVQSLLQSPNMSAAMGAVLSQRLNTYQVLLTDPDVKVELFQLKDDNVGLAGVSSSVLPDKRLQLKIVMPHVKSEPSADDIGSQEYVTLDSSVDTYRQFKAEAYDTPSSEDKDVHYAKQDWNSYYVTQVARLDGYERDQTQEEEMQDFGADMPAVVYELERRGLDSDSQLYQYIYNQVLLHILTSTPSPDSVDAKRIGELQQKCQPYQQRNLRRGTSEWTILNTLINKLHIVDLSFDPNPAVPYPAPRGSGPVGKYQQPLRPNKQIRWDRRFA